MKEGYFGLFMKNWGRIGQKMPIFAAKDPLAREIRTQALDYKQNVKRVLKCKQKVRDYMAINLFK